MWEEISTEEGKGTLKSSTSRMKVPGGWMVRVSLQNGAAELAVAISFLSDPDHKWQVDN